MDALFYYSYSQLVIKNKSFPCKCAGTILLSYLPYQREMSNHTFLKLDLVTKDCNIVITYHNYYKT